MKNRAICKRCHRIRPIGQAGYCEACNGVLRGAERPRARPPAPEVETDEGEKLIPGTIRETVLAQGAVAAEPARTPEQEAALDEFLRWVRDTPSDFAVED